MAEKKRITAYSFLDEYRETLFNGEWPTLPELFKISVKRFGERNCFTDFLPQRRTLTYNSALETILKLAQFLRSKGVEKGDRVAVSGKNSTEWVCVYLAANFCGAIIVPIDYALRDDEIQNLLNTAQPKLFFVDEERFEHFSSALKFEVYSLSSKYEDKYVFSLKSEKTYELDGPAEDDVAAILFTSGTTGNPKGVMLTHKNFVSCCFIAQANLKLYCTDVFYALLPIHHSYTMQAVFIESLSVGAETVFGKTMAVSKMMKELREGKVTMFLGVPLLFNKLLDGIMKGIRKKGIIVYGIIRMLMGFSYIIKKITGKNPGRVFFGGILKKANLNNIRIMISGGGPLSPSVFKQYNQLGVDFVQGYGLTETAPILTLNPKENFKIDSVGRFDRNDMTIKILDPDEKGVGEIAAKGPMVMKGYYNMPEETAEVFTEDGFFKTGDLGRIDSEDYVYICGRAKNMIVTVGGKNVYPEEIENEFQTYFDEIDQITVVGYSEGKEEGEKIEAQVYPTDSLFEKFKIKRDDDFQAPQVLAKIQELVASVNQKLQPYARISKLTILKKPLEMTSTKKVKRNAIKKGDDASESEEKNAGKE